MAVNQNHHKTVLVKVKTLHSKGHSRVFNAKCVQKAGGLKNQFTVNPQHRLLSLQRELTT